MEKEEQKAWCVLKCSNQKLPINGLDVDIFALGVLLFRLVTGEDGFKSADDASYNDIKFKNETNFWMRFCDMDNLPLEFKKLYFSMVAYNPKERPR